MKKTIKILSFFIVCALLCLGLVYQSAGVAEAQAIGDKISPDVTAKSALLVEKTSGIVLYENNADKKLPMASMTKLVGLGVVFDALEQGKIKLDQKVIVSKEAADMEGSEAFLDAGKLYLIEDLIKTVIISSANDSMVALAESVSGSESNFVRKMNELADDLGMNDSMFSNSTGLPCADHYSTPRDMVKIYKKICDNEVYKKYANVWIDELVHPSGRKTQLVNTNRLVKFYKGATGGKTGFTNEAGFCLTASAKKGDMELIAVVFGDESSKSRFASITSMFDYGFDNFENRVVVKKGEKVGAISIKGAKEKETAVYASKDYVRLLTKGEKFECNTALETYHVKAPISANTKVGSLLILDHNNIVVDEIDVVTGKDIEPIRAIDIMHDIFKVW